MKHTHQIKRILSAIAALTLALLLAASPALAAGLEDTVRTYLTGDNGGASAAGTFPDGTKRNVGAEQVNANYDTYTFLDIRTDELYNAGHIKGAYHIVYGQDIADQFRYVPLDKDIVVISNDGQLSWQLTGALNVILLNEGINTKIICWQSGYTEEGIDAGKISKDATELPAETNALSDAGNQLLSDYFAKLPGAQYPNFIVDEASTWNVINEIKNNNKEYTEKYAVVLLPAFGGTYVGQFNNAIFRSDYGGEAGANTLLGISKDRTVLVACGSGQTSDNTAGALRVLGYDAYSVAKGWGGNKGEVTGTTKGGGIKAYDASQASSGKRALFEENATGVGLSVLQIVLIAAAAVVILAVAVLLILRSKKKKAKAAEKKADA